MKEFEKWCKRTYYQWDALCSSDKMKIAWKAALEWSACQAETIYGYPSEQMGKAIPLDIINEELGEE